MGEGKTIETKEPVKGMPLWSILAVFTPISLLFPFSDRWDWEYVIYFNIILVSLISLVYIIEMGLNLWRGKQV